MSATHPRMLFDIPLPLELFSEAASGRDKNSSSSTKQSSSPMLGPSIVSRELSNPLLRLYDNFCILKKGKPIAALMSYGLRDLGYITNLSGSQNSPAMRKYNTNSIENS